MRETKTVQVYPSDSIVNSTISEYESFGWEVVGNQRCQEYNGQTHGIDGSTTNHYSTFNKITFSREKDSPWYSDVTQFEKEYYVLNDTIDTYKAYRPVQRKPSPEGSMGVLLGIFLYCLWLVPGIIYTIARACVRSKYKKQYNKALAEYVKVYPAKIEELHKRTIELRRLSENRISGKA